MFFGIREIKLISPPYPICPNSALEAAERQVAILDRIRRNGHVLANELAIEFETSEDTIRRALRELAERGLCKRVDGGALAKCQSLKQSWCEMQRI